MACTITTREIHYTAADGTELIGYFAAPINQIPVAGILVAPEWWGRNEYTEQRARELAAHGYAALAIDMYGNKKVTSVATQANQWMTETFAQADTIVLRASAALEALAAQDEVNPEKLAAIGFCYGGKVMLDLARSGAPLTAVITFHANLSSQIAIQEGQVHADILVLHGEQDSMVSLDDVAHFHAEMEAAKVKHEIIIFENAKHGFSNPLADERAQANQVDLAYNATAEQQGLTAMYTLLDHYFKDFKA
ncbi:MULTISPECIES: dienelactone hydrolase family protein [unclassified Acinetobacter]|uniref:dienelactone hydrolase family protein n=1 Tax=unclassified Acinetobacter TaxID=196816 RepID=UPI002934CA5B|nr:MULTISPECIES: dienelactone hydrolase family protein [unclassified Acinetobacter]WOE33155.1 dienelactone hydrolase family protein [Acinetobacter sp. SAAs470]WOE38984.1 dienelactone hydrolase family protein [Acinetobacter sp. SAAs474]